MRTKSESRRQTIIETASEAFCERGFDGTSMSELAARLGGSKATLYNYFSSKEQLFAAVMVEAVREQTEPLVAAFCASKSVEAAVRKLAPAYVKVKLQPEVLAVNRMCVAEGERCGIGTAVFEEGPKPAWARISARIKAAMEAGELRKADPLMATIHLLALCEAGPVQSRLYNWTGEPTDAEIRAAGNAAADVFLRAYRAESPPS